LNTFSLKSLQKKQMRGFVGENAGQPQHPITLIFSGVDERIAEDDFSALGDTSTLADPSVVDDLVKNRKSVS